MAQINSISGHWIFRVANLGIKNLRHFSINFGWFTLIILQRMSKESFWYKNLFYNEYLKKLKLYFVANLQFFLILKLDCNKGLWDNTFTFTFKCIIISNHHMREAGNFVWNQLSFLWCEAQFSLSYPCWPTVTIR